eukprot:46892_1
MAEELKAHDKWVAFGITVLAGFAAFIGAFSIFCIKQSDLPRVIPIALSFSAGIILHLSFAHLVEESRANFHIILSGDEDSPSNSNLSENQINALSHTYTLLCIIGGIVLMIIFEKFSELLGHTHEQDFNFEAQDHYGSTELTEPTKHLTKSENTIDSTAIKSTMELNMQQLSYKIAIALVLHHLPEGTATYVALVYEFKFGILVALALSIHDIPVGISMGTTIYCATGSYIKPFIACLIAAIAYPIGAAIGVIIIEFNQDSELLNGICFGLVSGIMIYIVLIQVIPVANTQIDALNDKKIRFYSYISLFVGLLFMEISVILLALTGFEA